MTIIFYILTLLVAITFISTNIQLLMQLILFWSSYPIIKDPIKRAKIWNISAYWGAILMWIGISLIWKSIEGGFIPFIEIIVLQIAVWLKKGFVRPNNIPFIRAVSTERQALFTVMIVTLINWPVRWV